MCRHLLFLLILTALTCVAQPGMGNDCTIAGTWYGGSVVAYQMTVTPTTPAGHYIVMAEPMYVNPQAPLAAKYTGQLIKKADVYEGSILSLSGDKSFINLPGTNPKMPDLEVGWETMQTGGLQHNPEHHSVLWHLFRRHLAARNSVDGRPVGSGRESSSPRCPGYRPDSDPHT